MPDTKPTSSVFDNEPELAQWRKSIDMIDRKLLALLQERANISQKIAKTKPRTSLSLRPDRETKIIRDLLAQIEAPLDRYTVTAIWRQILAHSANLQAQIDPFMVSRDPDMLYLTRSYFGAQATPKTLSHHDAILTLRDNPFAIGVFSLHAGHAWWHDLPDTARVCAALPWLQDTPAQALVVATLPQQFSSDIHILATTRANVGDALVLQACGDDVLVAAPGNLAHSGNVLGGIDVLEASLKRER
ncbi:MAG: chorismate mutase [Pseudomonadota bacterium]